MDTFKWKDKNSEIRILKLTPDIANFNLEIFDRYALAIFNFEEFLW